MRKPRMWFLNRSDTNRVVQPHKTARSLKFRLQEEEEDCTIRVAKTKALITSQLYCVYTTCMLPAVTAATFSDNREQNG